MADRVTDFPTLLSSLQGNELSQWSGIGRECLEARVVMDDLQEEWQPASTFTAACYQAAERIVRILHKANVDEMAAIIGHELMPFSEGGGSHGE